MTGQTGGFRRMTFPQLLREYAIEIPIIQRDYVQGRIQKNKVLAGFLDSLRDAIRGEPVELDFIFGDREGETFRPLDGQQRLTTLFLLHWYAARRNGAVTPDAKQDLAKFTYETRISSREFCRHLATEEFEINWDKGENALNDAIIDCNWFSPSWRRDPTIRGMLRALDRIHGTFREVPDLWNHLVQDDNPPITSNFILLEDFDLSDELYIKMNARGKPLTPFENFKALFEKRIANEGWDRTRDEQDQFSIKVDTDWTDLLWDLCPARESGLRRIDGPYMNFFAHCLACARANRDTRTKEEADKLQAIVNEPNELDPADFTSDTYEQMYRWLDIARDQTEAFRNPDLNYWEILDDFTDHLLKEVILESGPQYQKRVLLYACFRFLEPGGETDEHYDDWRRVARNIVLNARIDTPATFMGAIRLIDELAAGCDDIYQYLEQSPIKSDFAKEQISEEQTKARIIRRNPKVKPLLQRLEEMAFCHGRIAFPLYCAGHTGDGRDIDFALLNKVAAVIESFSETGITDEIRRALLTIDDENANPPRLFFHYWYSWFYTKDLPKYCLISNDTTFRWFSHNPESRHFLKDLVLKLVDTSLENLLESFVPPADMPNWRRRLIQEPDLIKRATARYIAYDAEKEIIYPIPGIRPHDTEESRNYLKKNKIQ